MQVLALSVASQVSHELVRLFVAPGVVYLCSQPVLKRSGKIVQVILFQRHLGATLHLTSFALPGSRHAHLHRGRDTMEGAADKSVAGMEHRSDRLTRAKKYTLAER
jgi:hypothetical protein